MPVIYLILNELAVEFYGIIINRSDMDWYIGQIPLWHQPVNVLLKMGFYHIDITSISGIISDRHTVADNRAISQWHHCLWICQMQIYYGQLVTGVAVRRLSSWAYGGTTQNKVVIKTNSCVKCSHMKHNTNERTCSYFIHTCVSQAIALWQYD